MSESRPRPARKRPPNPRRLLPLLYAPISALFLGNALLGGKAFLVGAWTTSAHPVRQAVRDSVLGGHLPLWNPASRCGEPWLTFPGDGLFYPLHWLHWVLPSDQALMLGLLVHLTLAGVFLRSFLLRVGLADTGSFLGGALLACGTWAMAHLEHPDRLAAAIWIPAIWCGVWSAQREGRPRGVAAAAAALALSFLAGDPVTTLLGALSATLLAIALVPGTLSQDVSPGRLAAWPAAVLMAGLLVGVQLLPWLAAGASWGGGTGAAAQLSPWAPAGLLDPFVLGFPGAGRFAGPGEFAAGTFYVGGAALLWVAGAARALRRPRRPRRVRREDSRVASEAPVVALPVGWFLALGAVGALAWVVTGWEPFPSSSGLGARGAAAFLASAHLAALAAIGFRAVTRERERIRGTCRIALGLGLLLVLAWFLARGPLALLVPSGTERSPWLLALFVRGCLIVLTGAIGLVVLEVRSQVRFAWVAFVLADLFVTARWLMPAAEQRFHDDVPPGAAEIARRAEGHRVLVDRDTSRLAESLPGVHNREALTWARSNLLGRAGLSAGVDAAHGDPSRAGSRHDVLERALLAETTPPEIRERILDLWDVAVRLRAPGVSPADLPHITSDSDGVVRTDRDPGLHRAMVLSGWRTPGGESGVLDVLLSRSHDPGLITLLEAASGGAPPPVPERRPRKRGEPVEIERVPNGVRAAWQIGPAGMLRILESWDAGWSATVNGRPAPVYRADLAFLAVPVPEGPCEVSLIYFPPGLTRGAGATLLGVVALGLCLLAGRRRSVDVPPPPPDASSSSSRAPAPERARRAEFAQPHGTPSGL